jgi:hypothetical protein
MTKNNALPVSFLTAVLAVIGCTDPGVAKTCLAGSTDCGDGICRDLKSDDANCGTCANACAGPGRTCSAGACVYDLVTARNTCFLDGDPVNTNLKWTVCTANATSAWISSATAGGGQYHAEAICKALGYSAIGQSGGNCGLVCSGTVSGACPTTVNNGCTSPGPAGFDGGGTCGSDAQGAILCNTVIWTCVP